MYILISIFDFGKWSNWKYANTRICVFSVWPLPEVKNWFRRQIWNENVHISILIFFRSVSVNILKSKKMDFPLFFQKVILLWQGSNVEINYGFFRAFGPYFIGKSLGTFKIYIFGLWSLIPHPYLEAFKIDFSWLLKVNYNGTKYFVWLIVC